MESEYGLVELFSTLNSTVTNSLLRNGPAFIKVNVMAKESLMGAGGTEYKLFLTFAAKFDDRV